ncbi:MAG: T9SS type A sorting domain-containing protein [Bacteroidales bacterium]|nr:T9SS type A sorting domain-containing protein [Bacteroidales bacterium]
MKRSFTLIMLLACWLCLSGLPLRAQSFQWSRSAGSSTASSLALSYPTKIFRDSKDNIYYCLSFANSYSVKIEGRSVYRPRCNVEECCAVVCYDCEGNMKWYRTIFCHSYNTTGSSVSFRAVEMIEDTLVMSFNGIFQTLYLCDSTHVLDTMPVDEKTYALWMRTDNGRAIRTAYLGEPMSMVYSDNKLHLVGLTCMNDTLPVVPGTCYVYLSTPQGERFRHFALDFRYNKFPSVYFESAVYHNKYYFLYNNDWESDSLWFGDQLHVDNSSGGNTNSVLACFDSTGQCLWSRLLNANTLHNYYGASNMAIDESTGLIYVMAYGHGYDPAYPDGIHNIFDGDTLWGGDIIAHQGFDKLVLACYDTLGNKQWVKYNRGPGNMYGIGMSLLPGRKLAIGGGINRGDAILEGLHTNLRDDEWASYFAIYDLVKDSFVLLQTVQIDGGIGSYPYTFNTDKDGNLLFAGPIDEGYYVVCGSDTLYGSEPKTHVYYGRYGWPCDSAAHWPGPPQHTLTLNVGQPSMGTVSGAGTYSGGSQVPISATPYPGHAFDHWSDGSSDNPRTILLLSDSSITAHFVKQHTEGISPAEHPQPALFPNPATGQVQILGLDGEAPDVEIFDMTGRTVATFHHATTLDISRLPQGSYILSIQTATDKHHLKLVKRQ